MPIIACATQLPEHYYSQEDLLRCLERIWEKRPFNLSRLRQFHRSLNIEGRHLALPQEDYLTTRTFGERNAQFQRVSLDLAEQVVHQVLAAAGLEPRQISLLVFTTVTGLAVPSLDARLMNRIEFSPQLKRMPLFGLGCLGGAAGVARAADYLLGHPEEHALVLSIELCSLTLQTADISVANLVATGLFGDGAAAVVLSGAQVQTKGPRVVDTRSVFFPESEGVMGWDIGENGFSIVLSSEVPGYAQKHLAPGIIEFLSSHGLGCHDVGAWIAHPGGPKVVDALEKALGLTPDRLEATRRSLAQVGNLSSASVLFILKDFLAREQPAGTYGVMLAMGPAFCAEIVLLQW